MTCNSQDQMDTIQELALPPKLSNQKIKYIIKVLTVLKLKKETVCPILRIWSW